MVSKMNFPRYEFSKEVEADLIHFITIARKQKECNQNCDLDAYKKWSKLLNHDPNLISKAGTCENVEEIVSIDLTSPVKTVEVAPMEVVDLELDNNTDSSINDLVFGIKENLETHNQLTDIIIHRLTHSVDADLDELFKLLNLNLTSQDIFHLGICIQKLLPINLLSVYCKHLLIPRLLNEYCDNLSELVDQLSRKFGAILMEQITDSLQTLQTDNSVILIYMKKLNSVFKSLLVRNFIFTVDRLDNNYIEIVDNLLNTQVDYDALNKLVELMSNIAEDHSKDKNFGKLLMHAIEALGTNLLLLEQPLKHIIARHKSVWKSRLEKTFSSCYEDSVLFSQSFRE